MRTIRNVTFCILVALLYWQPGPKAGMATREETCWSGVYPDFYWVNCDSECSFQEAYCGWECDPLGMGDWRYVRRYYCDPEQGGTPTIGYCDCNDDPV